MTPYEYSLLMAELEAEAALKPMRPVLAPLPASFIAPAENVQRVTIPPRAPRAAKPKAGDVKFGRYSVSRGPNKASIRYITYLMDGPAEHVILQAKDYSKSLGKIFPDLLGGSDFYDKTDVQSDYFTRQSVRISEGSPYYSAALRAALNAKSKDEAQRAATLERRRTKAHRHSR